MATLLAVEAISTCLKFVPGPHPVASAYTHSAQLALLANLGFVLVALILVLALPREIPEQAGR